MKIQYTKLRTYTVLYALAPIILFYIGWLNTTMAILFSIATVIGFFFFLKSANKNDHESKSAIIAPKYIVFIAVITILWCFFAGQGSFIHQSKDNIIRNAIFRDMIKMPWPVVYNGDKLLSYYIAHWIVPASFGKAVLTLTGSVNAGYIAGNIALFIWSSLGCFITLMLITIITASENKARPVLSTLMFIFFSGLDILGVIICGYLGVSHLEWWAEFAQFSSITSCLFWVYNQAIVSWMITLCIINEKSCKNFAFLGILMFPFGPFPFIGIVLLCLIKSIKIIYNKVKSKKPFDSIKDIFSPQNIIMLAAAGIPYAMYYLSNSVIANTTSYNEQHIETGLRFHSELAQYISVGNIGCIAAFFARYLLFILLEAGVYLIILFIYKKKNHQKDPVFAASSLALLFIPLLQIGTAYDFSMRVSIPALIYIAVEFIKMITKEWPSKAEYSSLRSLISAKPFFIIAILIFYLGSFTALTEFQREITSTIYYGAEKKTDPNYLESLNDYGPKHNFVSSNYRDSNFYKYLLKK